MTRVAVYYEPTSGHVEAVTAHHALVHHQGPQDVTGETIVAVARWLVTHDDGTGPYEITTGDGTVFHLLAAVAGPLPTPGGPADRRPARD